MKKKYIKPEITVVELDATGVVCTSQHLGYADDRDGIEFESSCRRGSGWSDYER